METNANTAFLKIFISKKKFYNQSQGMPTDMTLKRNDMENMIHPTTPTQRS